MRNVRLALGVIALVLIPVLLYLAITQQDGRADAQFAFWAPLAVLLLDAVLFWIAFGAWQLTRWERGGLSVILPLLIAMASWAAMMGMVTAQLPPPAAG